MDYLSYYYSIDCIFGAIDDSFDYLF